MSTVACLNGLPEEIVVCIFKQFDSPRTLGKTEQVCKQWKRILDANSAIWELYLTKLVPGLSIVLDPKLALIAQFKPEVHYKNYADLNVTDAITANMVLKGIIEMMPFGRELAAFAWNYAHRQ